MKTVLITGASGFLGSKLSLMLAEKNYSVIANGRNEIKLHQLKHKNIKTVACDFDQLTHKVNEPFDVVVHCAALASPWGARETFYEANVEGTRSVLDFCMIKKVKRLVYISSPSVYVTKTEQFDIPETQVLPLKFTNYYSETKKVSEDLVLSDKYAGLEKIILRPQGIIGDGDQNIFPRLIELGKKGVLPIIGSGTTRLDLTCVENVCQAIELSINADKKYSGQIYNVTNDESIDLNETLRFIFDQLKMKYKEKKVSFNVAYALGATLELLYQTHLFGSEPPLTRYTACVLGKSRTLDISKIKTDLHYIPGIKLQDGIRQVIERFQVTS